MKTALISGSSRGIGKAIALKLASEGYHIYISGRNAEDLACCAEEVQKLSKVSLLNYDLTDPLQISVALDDLRKASGSLDVLITNIGSGRAKLGWDVSPEEWQRVFQLNFFSAVDLITQSIPLLKKTEGSIVSIASIAGCEALGAPLSYSVAKSALISFTKNLARELSPLNIRVNCVSPGNVLFEGSVWDKKLKENKADTEKYIQDKVPMRSFMKPEDIAFAVSYLVNSPRVTAQNLVVDGGQIHNLV